MPEGPRAELRRIRQLYLLDSTVTIVLIGKCTWARKFVDWETQASLRLIEARGVRRFVVDPAAANLRAIRAYESIGFKRIGVARQSEPAPDGSWRDCLLMDLPAAEFQGRS
jgi:hypothetical protein